jgi:tetratricopeptide (TPR) repeat protein
MPGETRTAILRLATAMLACICLFSCATTRNQGEAQETRESENDGEPQAVQDTRLLLDTRTTSIQVRDVTFGNTVRILEDLTGLEVEIAPVLDADVTLTLYIRDIVIKNVLGVIAGQAECDWEITGSGAILFREKHPEGMTNDKLSRHYHDKGRAAFDADDYEKAKWYFKRAVQFNTDNEDARKMLYRTMWMLGERTSFDPDLASRRQALIAQQREQLVKDYNAGKKLFEAGEYQRAKELFEQCIERVYWFPYPLDTPPDCVRMCKQAIRECDRRLKEESLKEK